jgi:hypothetical protein
MTVCVIRWPVFELCRLQKRLLMSKAVLSLIQAEESRCRADLQMVYNCRDQEEGTVATAAYFLMAEVTLDVFAG